MTPRRYQQRAIENFLVWAETPSKLGTVILPMGLGKTVCARWALEALYKKRRFKTLWCAHREELIAQAAEELREIPDVNIEIEMAENHASLNADIVVGSVQTLHRNRKNIREFVPDIVVVDEWHHYHEQNKQYHGLMEKYPDAKFLGLTATPYRFIGGDLPVGDKLIEMDIGTAVAHEYLVPPKPEALRTKISLANVKTRAGDFAINELSEAINVEERNQMIAKRVIQAVKEEHRQGILFSADVAHSKAMAEIIRKEVRVGEVYGETDKDERRETVERIRNGEIDVLCNNLCATEGWNIPHLSFVCMARPTKSLGLYTQCFGRGLRLHEDKKDCLVIDVFDLVKIAQKRITFSDVAAEGDIDGSRRRSTAIMKEKLAEKIENFPVVMSLNKKERWTLDNDTWFAPSWILDTNQWVITWTKNSERTPTQQTDLVTIDYTPRQNELKSNPMPVVHDKFGDGYALTIVYGTSTNYLTVDFGRNGIRNVPITMLKKKMFKFINKKLDRPIRRAFYIIMNDDKTCGRMLSLIQEKNSFKIESDIKGDITTIDECIKAVAREDDMFQIVRTNAKWRERPASENQKKLLRDAVLWGKLDEDLDFNSMSMGEMSVIIDQLVWRDTINKLFGAKNKKDLIGYSYDLDDVQRIKQDIYRGEVDYV